LPVGSNSSESNPVRRRNDRVNNLLCTLRRHSLSAVAFAALLQPAWSQQPLQEHIIAIDGPVHEAIETQVARLRDGGRPEVLRLSDMLIYPFGHYQPVLTCTVLRACLVELEKGEALISLITGDDQRWLIDHTSTGAGGMTPLVSVKPVDYNITTNLIVSTDRRVYHITLDSPPRTSRNEPFNPLGPYTRHIRFYYPRSQITLNNTRELKAAPTTGLTVGQLNHQYIWRKSRKFPWEPIAVFDDGERVYIRLPGEADTFEHPLLSVGRKGQERVADYVLRDGYFIVSGLFEHARLILSGPAGRNWLGRSRRAQYLLHIRRDGQR